MSKRISHLLIIGLLLAPIAASAAWSSAPHLNDAICTADDHQWVIGICRDGSGGYLVAWGDDRDPLNPHQVYMQHLDADGNRLWGEGLRVYDSYGNIGDWAMCPDGAGGAYIAICDQVGGSYYTVVMQYVAAGGALPWGLQGMIATTGAVDDMQTDVAMVEDGYGGAYVIWSDLRSAEFSMADLWMQRVNASGPTWGSIGVNICNRAGDQRATVMARCPGGVVLAWEDGRDMVLNRYDIYAQRLDGGGTRQWTFTGEPVSVHPEHQLEPSIASDGAGGAFIAWADYRDSPTSGTDLFAQHLDATGARLGVIHGSGVCWDDASLSNVHIVSDGGDGAYVAWVDYRDDGFDGDTIYAQHLGNNVTPVWNTGGIVVCANDGRQGPTGFNMGTAGNGDLVMVWPDERDDLGDLYAQRMSSTTALQWPGPGLLVSNAPGRQQAPELVVEADGSCVAVWLDRRADGEADIYLQRIDGQGILGLPVSGVGDPALPSVVALRQNVPNPFNPSTTITFELAAPARAYLSVYDASGRTVRTLIAGELRQSGPGRVVWNGRDDRGYPVATGVYFYRLEAGGYSETKRMVLVK